MRLLYIPPMVFYTNLFSMITVSMYISSNAMTLVGRGAQKGF